MNLLVLMSTFIYLATVNSRVLPSEQASTNIQGPSSRSRIMGPDGSVINAQAPGGQITHEETPGVFEPAGRFLGPASPFINPAVAGLAAHNAVDTAIAGPSGTIATGRYVAQRAEDGTQSVMGGFGTPNVGVKKQ